MNNTLVPSLVQSLTVCLFSSPPGRQQSRQKMPICESLDKRDTNTGIYNSSVKNPTHHFLSIFSGTYNKLTFGVRCNTMFNPEILFPFFYFFNNQIKIRHLFINFPFETTCDTSVTFICNLLPYAWFVSSLGQRQLFFVVFSIVKLIGK